MCRQGRPDRYSWAPGLLSRPLSSSVSQAAAALLHCSHGILVTLQPQAHHRPTPPPESKPQWSKAGNVASAEMKAGEAEKLPEARRWV